MSFRCAVVIQHKDEITPEHCQSLAAALEITAFDARQRLICRGPVVVTIQADQQRAKNILSNLKASGFHAFLVDVEAAMTKRPTLVVKNSRFEDDLIRVWDAEERRGSIAYSEIKLILPSSRSELKSEPETVTQRKFSIGKTLMAACLNFT